MSEVELSKHELYELIVIADKTPHYDLTKSAIALLMRSPLLFQKPIPTEEEEMEALSAAWGPVCREVMQSVPVPTVDDIRPTDDGSGSPAAPESQSEKTVTEMPAEEGARLDTLDVPIVGDLAATKRVIKTVRVGPISSSRDASAATIMPAKPKRKSPDWSAEETERLIAYVDANPSPRHWDAIVSEFPGRTGRALQNRADRLGLGKSGGAKAGASENPDVPYDVATERLKSQRHIEPNPMPSEPPGVKTSPGTEIRAQQVTQAKENLDEMFPPSRSSAIRESPPSQVESNSSKAKPAATFPPAWEPKETFKAPETIDDVMAWCRRQGDNVSQDGKMFTVNNRRLFPSEFIARANNLRVAAGVKPFEVAAE